MEILNFFFDIILKVKTGAKATTRVDLKWQIVLLQGCSLASARVSSMHVKHYGTRGTRAPSSCGKVNFAVGSIKRPSII